MSRKRQPTPQEQQPLRVRTPKSDEILGVVLAKMGGGRMLVVCNDGKERLSRIPGKLRRRVWVKEGDVVAIRPWETQPDERADIVWRYKPLEAKWLREKGYLKV